MDREIPCMVDKRGGPGSRFQRNGSSIAPRADSLDSFGAETAGLSNLIVKYKVAGNVME
jgi:hypothetical protein